MGNLNQESDSGTARVHTAVELFVENGSDRELDPAAVWRWEEWCDDARNLGEYAEIVKMTRQVLLVPTPSPCSSEQLVADVGLEGLSDLGAE
jgi:hypothetical protein